MAIALLIVGLIIGVVIGYFIAPKGVTGVSEEEYNKVVEENKQLKAQIEELKKQIGAAPEKQVITITVWAVGPDEPSVYRFEAFKVAAEKLNKMLKDAGANVEIKIEGDFWTQSWGDYKKRFLLAMQTGKGPDIYCTGHEDVATHAEAGYIIPLDDYIQKYWDTVYYDVFPSLWESVTYKGKIWAVPQDTEARPIYFRKDALRALGWSERDIEELPEKVRKGEFTLMDLVNVAKQAVEAGVVEYGLVHRPSPGWDYQQFYLAYGGRLWDPNSGKLVFSKTAWKKTLEFFYKAATEWKIVDPHQFGGEWKIVYHGRFTEGKALFASGGTWHKAEWIQKYGLTEESFWENIGFMLHPAGEPGLKPVTLSHPLVYMIPSTCKNPDLAFLLITLVTDPHINSLHAVNSGHLAILRSEVSDTKYQEDPFLAEVAYMLEYTTFIPLHPKYGQYNDIIYRAVSAAESGEISVDEVFNTFLQEVQSTLGEDVIIED